eukprot:scaffold261_cov336-Pavlova_lutheri.AAC.39
MGILSRDVALCAASFSLAGGEEGLLLGVLHPLANGAFVVPTTCPFCSNPEIHPSDACSIALDPFLSLGVTSVMFFGLLVSFMWRFQYPLFPCILVLMSTWFLLHLT